MQATKDLLRLAVDTIPGLVWSAQPNGHFDFMNQRWLDYTGLTLDQAVGAGWETAIHPDDLPRLLEQWRSAMASGAPREVEARFRRFDGHYRWFHFRAEPLFDEQGSVVKWYGLNTDIQDRKSAEDRIRQDEMEFRQIVEAIPHLILVLSPDGQTRYANKMVLDYTGRTLEEVQAGNFRERTFHPDDVAVLREQRREGLARGAPFELEQRARRHDGQFRWFLARYNPFRDVRGHVIQWYVTATDIHDRKQAEDHLRSDKEQLHRENIALREEVDQASMFEEIVGASAPLKTVLARVAKVAPADSTVLITGETGTGKELIARAIHKRSQRSSRPFVSVNCAAISQSLIASELFGHEKGAFTGALQRRLGRFELAEGGTIFLDEVGELPLETQVSLLRVLQEREFERVGGNQLIRADVRIIAATNRDLQAAIVTNAFRSDLYYRFNVFPIEVPPLRERLEDIRLLAEYFISRYARQAGRKFQGIDKKTLESLQSYPWPGNIRELQNVIERSIILCDTENFSVDESWLSRPPQQNHATHPVSLSKIPATREKEMIESALAAAKGRVSGALGAAAALGVSASTLESKIRALKIDKQKFKPA